jgi:hypothetical protein
MPRFLARLQLLFSKNQNPFNYSDYQGFLKLVEILFIFKGYKNKIVCGLTFGRLNFKTHS